MQEEVILVDENDVPVGTMEKMEAHQKGLLHRAFSVFIFNDSRELLLQQRAKSKYHSGGLWTNTCCSHPRPEETTHDAAKRRLREEMGMECELNFSFSFIYRAALDHDLTEHEFDHVFVGKSNQNPVLNKAEAENYAWKSVKLIREELKENPRQFTAWFKICFEELVSKSRT